MRKLVVTSDTNTIYWATINEKNNKMNENTRVDVTDNALNAVFEHLTNTNDFKEDGFVGCEYTRKDTGSVDMLCAFNVDVVTFIARDRYNELLEYEKMHKGLCR